ncbi:MAG: SURF1 family cytochrome oxidase biogenesis protein [Alphaproteobacteria bacterium]
MMNDAAQESRRPGAGFVVAALGAIGVLLALGTWQLDRLQWKRALVAERQAIASQPPTNVTAAAAVTVTDYQPVSLTGTLRHDAEMLIGPRVRKGRPGWRVVTPLGLAGGGLVLVDRGWVSVKHKTPVLRSAGQVTGVVTIVGFARLPGPRGRFMPDNEPEKGQWFRVSPDEMAAARKLDHVAGWWLVAGAAPNPGGWPKGGAAIAALPDNHLRYAFIWYALALAASVIATMVWVRGRR